MTQESTIAERVVLAELGRKIGIPDLVMEDFDLVFAAASSVDAYCDQFEALDLTPLERFHFMQLIVASLDLALRDRVPLARANEQRVERLLLNDIASYKYIIDYWAHCREFRTQPMMNRLKKNARYVHTGGEAQFE